MKVAPFSIQVRYRSYRIRLQVRQLTVGIGVEEFEVLARNGSIVFQSNRPMLIRKGLKKRKPDVTLKKGELKDPRLVEDISQAIVNHIFSGGKNGKE